MFILCYGRHESRTYATLRGATLHAQTGQNSKELHSQQVSKCSFSISQIHPSRSRSLAASQSPNAHFVKRNLRPSTGAIPARRHPFFSLRFRCLSGVKPDNVYPILCPSPETQENRPFVTAVLRITACDVLTNKYSTPDLTNPSTQDTRDPHATNPWDRCCSNW